MKVKLAKPQPWETKQHQSFSSSFNEQKPSMLYCSMCGGVWFHKDELRNIPYTMIEPGVPCEYNEDEDRIMYHSIQLGGCGKQSMILRGHLAISKKRTRTRTKRAPILKESTSEEDEEDNEEEETMTEEKTVSVKRKKVKLASKSTVGRIPVVVIKYMASRDIKHFVRAVVREQMYNTFVVDFGKLHQQEMIHRHGEPLVTAKDGPKHVKPGLIYPEGFTTLTFTKENIYETKIVYKDGHYSAPLYQMTVYNKEEETGFCFVARNEVPSLSAKDAIKSFESKLSVIPSYPKVVAAIEYDGVKRAIVDHFKNLVGGCSKLYDKRWLHDL